MDGFEGNDHLRHQEAHLLDLFGKDSFGRAAEAVATFLGTPAFLIGQTLVTAAWIVFNVMCVVRHQFDPYPFILLNLAYSIQAGFAGPFVLCAQTRQAKRDGAIAAADAMHREELATTTQTMLKDLTAKLGAK